jgi:hypothetical protein
VDEGKALIWAARFRQLVKRCMLIQGMVEFRALERDFMTRLFCGFPLSGGMAEWLKAPVLKTGMEKSIVGSNPSPSANGEVPERPIGLAC